MANHHARLAKLRQAQIEEAARSTDMAELARLSGSADVLVRVEVDGLPVMAVEEAPVRRILEQRQVVPEIFEVLAGGQIEVRLLLAKDPRAPESVLDELARHHNTDIRKAVAANPGAGEATLVRLAGDPEGQVADWMLPAHVANVLAQKAKTNPRLKFGLRVREQFRGDPSGLKALLDTVCDERAAA